MAGLLRHPTRGWFLWDTGYAPRILDALRPFPFLLYRWVTPMVVTADLSVVRQIARLNVCAGDIQHIVLSHFHADHVAGLRDFPLAKFVATSEAWAAVRTMTGLRAVARAFVPALLPADFQARAVFIDAFSGPLVTPFGHSHDLFGDGSALIVPLPGHARGQIGLLAQTGRGPVFFAADSCFVSASIRDRVLPHPLTRLFVDDWAQVGATLHRVADFAYARPDVAMVPSHCPEVFHRFLRAGAP